uniref:hypothetical protein n=1 Tax=Pararhizobium sp. IMCC3301 TaxID=3067904 RepID=UPI002741A95E|nr:hypothetical protein [Pararhizobium sp. IMCC3301]
MPNTAKQILTDTGPATVAPSSSYLEWGAIMGGAVLAGGISVVLLQFGAGTGLAMGSATLADGSASWNVLVAGLYVVIVAIASSSAGGYIAGRMRSKWADSTVEEVEFRDGAHGLVVWAVATLGVAVVMGALTAISALGAAAAAAATDIPENTLRLTANVSAIFSFASAAGALLGAAAAWFSATLGGEHRDQGLSVHEVVPLALRRRTAK